MYMQYVSTRVTLAEIDGIVYFLEYIFSGSTSKKKNVISTELNYLLKDDR